ncbi:MAG: hypothetical protein ACKVQS_03195 [Fimbriimonadaceae bacterium]
MVTLIPESSGPLPEFVAEHAKTSNYTICDFHVPGVEFFTPEPYGYSSLKIKVVDHHAPDPRWERFISSGALALEYVKTNEPANEVILNHTDCDSILSAAIVTGLIPPLPEFGLAAIAADHTGEENPIADLLQDLQHIRDFDLSLQCLNCLLEGKPIPPAGIKSLETRLYQRDRAIKLASQAEMISGIATITTDSTIDSVLLVNLLPQAKAIVITLPVHDDPTKSEVKIRLGMAAPAGTSLQRLNITDFLPGFGCRWNAGSNRRGGGSTLTPSAAAFETSTTLSNLLRA